MNSHRWLWLLIILHCCLYCSCNTIQTNCLTGFHVDEGVCISDRYLLADHHETLDDFLSSELIIKAPKSVSVGETVPLRIWLDKHNDTAMLDKTSEVELISFNEDIVSVDGEGKLQARKEGLTFIRARLDNIWSELFRIQVLDHTMIEARGLWVNRWAYRTKSDVERIISKAHRAGFNQIYFQVRGTFDAYYNSSLEPWAKRLSGKLGQNPGWDPLQVAIESAHQKGMELHAWINVFTLWESSAKFYQNDGITHKYAEYDKLLMKDQNKSSNTTNDGYLWVSPASLEIRNHNAMVVRDIITHYDVDGIHLDRVRYPSEKFGFEDLSIKRFEMEKINSAELDFSEWRRRQITNQVNDIYRVITDNKPKVVLSAAVCGIYRDEWQWNSVTEGYVNWLQDWKSWAELEIIDVLIPMVYWSSKPEYGQVTDFETLAEHNSSMVKNRFVYIGSDLLAAQDAESRAVGLPRQLEKFSELKVQLEYNRETVAKGAVIYDYATLEKADYWEQLSLGPFKYPAKVPFMWWKELKTQPPALGRMLQTSSSSDNGVFHPFK